jgi:hypothetical protein
MSVLDVIWMPFGEDGKQAYLESHKINCYPEPGKIGYYKVDIIKLSTQEVLEIYLGGRYFPILFVPMSKLDAFIAYLVHKGY